MAASLLIIDDEENMRHMLKAMLARSGYAIELAANGVEGLEIVRQRGFDYILCDIRMPEMDGMEFIKQAKNLLSETTVIMMSAYGTVDLALEAIKNGAYDFISKPFKTDEVLLTLKKAAEREALKRENSRLKKEIVSIRQGQGFGKMIGKCQAMQELFELATKVAQYDSSVLITGESGTGKELVAKGIHYNSQRVEKELVAVNCGSIPSSLMESEFFGHTRGAFTGAERDKRGLFEVADGGTLFLDEIGELPLQMQVKLLRVLQEREIRPIGSNSTKKVDVRVIAATAKDLYEEVELGNFRQDLLFRFNVVECRLPPLRERHGDIPILINHFIKRFRAVLNSKVKGVDKKVLSLLSQHKWPGNIRELENVIEHAMIYAENENIQPKNLPERLHYPDRTIPEMSLMNTYSLKEGKVLLEKQLIVKALASTKGNKSKASLLLEISYPALLSKIKEYGLEVQ